MCSNHCDNTDTNEVHFEYSLISFNSHTPLQTSEKLFSVEAITAWRLFYTYFLDGHRPPWDAFLIVLLKHQPTAAALDLKRHFSYGR
jgi:hypothetical protein